MRENKKLHDIAKALVAPKKGILAADQSAKTMNKQLEGIGATGDAETRRAYRQILMTTEGLEEYVSGVILYDGTIRNITDDGTPFADLLVSKGIIPIIKVDTSTRPHPNFPGEVYTQGIDGLADRLAEYYDMGARATKWRNVFTIGEDMPSDTNIELDVQNAALYASLVQNAGMVPMMEPEVIYAGSHSIQDAEKVTVKVIRALFDALTDHKVDLEGLILKSSMVLAGSDYKKQSTPEEVAKATIRTFKAAVPTEIPGIVFLSGGQTPEQATVNLDAIAELETKEGDLPWQFAFSFSRGLEKPAQEAWQGKAENVPVAQAALLERLRLNSLADEGDYEAKME